jgi:hypothetical protein
VVAIPPRVTADKIEIEILDAPPIDITPHTTTHDE